MVHRVFGKGQAAAKSPKQGSQRGQLSFDLMFAILALLIVIQALNTMAQSISEISTLMSVKQQELQIAQQVADVVRRSEAFSDGTVQISYKIPKISVSGFSAPVGCDVRIELDSVTVSVDGLALGISDDPDPILQSAPIGTGSTLNNPNLHCGGDLTIS